MSDRPLQAPDKHSIVERLSSVYGRIERAALRAGRDPESVKLVAVTKGFGPEVIRWAHQAGLREIGENRVEEAEPKQALLQDLTDLSWHMIGHIQSRKAKRVVPAFGIVHSVDRLKIARLLDRHAGILSIQMPVLLECNVSGEPTKDGWKLADQEAWDAATNDFVEILKLPHLEVLGLMTIAPLSSTAEDARPIFRRLGEARAALENRLSHPLPELSMGMTDDFEVAVEEGATILRIGRAIFGPRPARQGHR